MIFLGVAVGTAVGYVMKDSLGDGPASAASSGTLTTEAPEAATGRPQITVSSTPHSVPAPAAESAQPAVIRFAWDSTCAVALIGLANGGSGEIIRSFDLAHDQAALFEPGIVPLDVATALDDGYDGIVVPQDRGDGQADQATLDAVGGAMSSACAAWSQRIAALG